MAEDNKASNKTDDSGSNLKTKLLSPAHWIRILIMVLMYIVLFFGIKYIVCFVAIIQWILSLVTGEPNEKLKEFTSSLNQYGFQILQFLTLNSDERPFPLSDWPAAK